MRHLAKIGFGLASFLMAAGVASAQQEMNLRDQGLKPYSVELKPLPTAFSFVPGVGSVGVGGEVFFLPKVAWFVDGQYTDADLPNKVVQKTKDSNPSEPAVHNMMGYNVVSGVRYYAAPALHSWYGTIGAGYAEAKSRYDYENTSIDSKVTSVTPTLVGGYRWIFANNVLIRLGLGASANFVQTQKATAEDATQEGVDGEKKVTDLQKTPVLAAVDLGLGYAF